MSESSGDENQSYPQGNAPHDKNWEWIACVYDMKRSTPESEITWNLSPSIMLTLPSEQNVQPKVDLIIESSKQFIYSEGLGWNWHKSWNIPDIHCTLDAEIYVVRAVINQIHTFHLVDVGIKGGNRSEFDSSRCVFTGLKFDTTSYNHEGSKFHLVIVVYLNQNKFEHPKILESRISPPIFVDSRKSARDTQQQKAQKLSSFIDPFLPENMDKKFVKRESKRKYNSDEPIENNIEGLSNFFSAPNIRHKVKHPLFLAIKFSGCVKIYFNVNIIPANNNNEKFVEVMQKQLMEAYNRSSTNTNINIEEKPLILTIEHNLSQQSFKQKKINEFLEPLHGDVLHVMIDPVNIPKNFKKLEDIDGVKEAYRKVYPKISQQKFSQGGDDDDSNPPPPTKKGSKVKVEKETNKKNYQSDDSDDEYQGANPSKKIKGNEDQSHVQSVIDNKKLQMKNPAQQSEIVLNQSAQNQQQMKSMIMQGAKPQKEKMPKGAAEKTPATKTEETPKAAKGGRGKKGAKNVAPPNVSEPISMPSSQNLASQSQLPTQIPSTTQFSQQNVNGIAPLQQSMGASGSQTVGSNPTMQWQQQHPNMQKPPLNNSQQMYPGAEGLHQPIKPGVTGGFPQTAQQAFNQQAVYGANQTPQVGTPLIDGSNGLGGFDPQKSLNHQGGAYGQQSYPQPGQGIPGGQQQLNGMMPQGHQRPPHLVQQGYPQSQMGPHSQGGVVNPVQQQPGLMPGQAPYLNGSGQTSVPGLPPQQGMGGINQNQYQQIKPITTPPLSATKEGYEDPSLIGRVAGGVQAASTQFKPPTVGGNLAHLNQSQHYMGANPAVAQTALGVGDVTSVVPDINDPLKQQHTQIHGQQAYNLSQASLQQQQQQTQVPQPGQSAQYNPQNQQYPQYQRNNSSQFPQQQQQGRFMPNQINQTKGVANPSQSGGQFYDQSGNQFIQNGVDMNQYNNNGYTANPQGSAYQVGQMGGQNYGYPEEDDQFNYQNNYNRYSSASQGQFQFGQGQGGQNAPYNNYNYQQQQQGHQNLNNQAYNYGQPQQYNSNNFAQNDPSQQMYFKQQMNPQFQYYQQQQQQQPAQQSTQPTPLGNEQQPIQYPAAAGQIRAHSNSIPQQGGYFQSKEDEY